MLDALTAIARRSWRIDQRLGRQRHEPLQSVRGVTANLAFDFFGSAQVGQWLEFTSGALNVGKTLSFADCLVLANGEPVARGNAAFRTYAVADRP